MMVPFTEKGNVREEFRFEHVNINLDLGGKNLTKDVNMKATGRIIQAITWQGRFNGEEKLAQYQIQHLKVEKRSS